VPPSQGDRLGPHAFAHIGLSAAADTIDAQSPDCGKPRLQREKGRKRDRPRELRQDIKIAVCSCVPPDPRAEQGKRADRPLSTQTGQGRAQDPNDLPVSVRPATKLAQLTTVSAQRAVGICADRPHSLSLM
jgi:hypothetical protein